MARHFAGYNMRAKSDRFDGDRVLREAIAQQAACRLPENIAAAQKRVERAVLAVWEWEQAQIAITGRVPVAGGRPR